MRTLFIPMRLTGRASVRNSFSISTASRMMRSTVSGCGRRSRWEKRRQAKSVWRPSSREMSSLEKVSPGMRPRFLSQKMEAKEPVESTVRGRREWASKGDAPEKKIPSTAANATRRSPNVDRSSEIHLSAQSAFFLMQGTGEKARKSTEGRDRSRRRTGVDSLEELLALLGLADVGVDEERVDLRVDVLPARTRQLSPLAASSQRWTNIMIWKP